MQAKTLSATSLPALEAQLTTLQEANFKATLAIIFTSPRHSLVKIQQIFLTRNIKLVGCTSAGEIADCEVLEGSITCLIFDIQLEYTSIYLTNRKSDSTYQSAFMTGQFALTQFEHPALVVMSGGVTVNADKIVMGLRDALPISIPVFGGLASDDLSLQKTLVFTEDEICEDGLLTLILDNDKIEVKGLAASGWKALGGTNTITSADGNIVYTINDQPALDVYLRYFGTFDNLNTKVNDLTTISAQYPLQILRADG
ncbi:MAG: FIST signal transduction protein, partial [Saprospiraceae bacterium]